MKATSFSLLGSGLLVGALLCVPCVAADQQVFDLDDRGNLRDHEDATVEVSQYAGEALSKHWRLMHLVDEQGRWLDVVGQRGKREWLLAYRMVPIRNPDGVFDSGPNTETLRIAVGKLYLAIATSRDERLPLHRNCRVLEAQGDEVSTSSCKETFMRWMNEDRRSGFLRDKQITDLHFHGQDWAVVSAGGEAPLEFSFWVRNREQWELVLFAP